MYAGVPAHRRHHAIPRFKEIVLPTVWRQLTTLGTNCARKMLRRRKMRTLDVTTVLCQLADTVLQVGLGSCLWG